MEQKCMRTPVFTGETIFTENLEQPIDVDFTLPDYCPEIQKILKCRAVSRISSKGINGSSINVDGYITVTVIYCDTANKLCSYEYQYPFNKSCEVNVDTDGAQLNCKTKCEYINCRAVTGKKIDIHGAAGIYITLKKRKCTEVISDIDDKNIEILRGLAPATSPMGNNEKYLVLDEEIELGSNAAIHSLIRYDGKACIKDCKLIAGKAMVKGELVLTALYCNENGSTETIKTMIPFSQLIEIEGVNEDCECEAKAEIAFIELKPRTNSAGDTKTLQLSAKILISCEGYCNNDIDVVLDAYSRKFEAKIVKNEVCFNKIHKNINETFNCKKNIELMGEGILSVNDMWCDAKCERVTPDNDGFLISGNITASIIVTAESGEVSYFEKPIPFEHKCGEFNNVSQLSCKPAVSVVSSSFTLTGNGNVEIRADLSLNATVYETTKASLIVDVDVDEKTEFKRETSAALTVYFAECGEKLWDIARRYTASVDEIKQINGVTEDVLDKETAILVPIC